MKTAPALFKRLLFPKLRRTIRDTWESMRDWVDAVGLGLSFMLRRQPLPDVLIYFGFALGDDLLCTAVVRELQQRDRRTVAIFSNHAALFEGNNDIAYVRAVRRRYYPDRSTVATSRRYAQIWGGTFIRPEYSPPIDGDRRRPPTQHIIAEMCARASITGTVSARPYLTLDPAELASGATARGCIAIQSNGLVARHPMRNKQWEQTRFQAVVDALADTCAFIQVGSATDPPLHNVTDRRGTGIKETAALLHNARLYVGAVGFLMHLARAVECPSVIVFGGREAPWQSGYICNANLYTEMPCAPCWQDNTCELGRRCMEAISVEDVVAAIRTMLDKPRNPLAVEQIGIERSAATVLDIGRA